MQVQWYYHRRFITEAVENELVRRKRLGLLSSLQSPPPDAAQLIDMGLSDWNASLPAGDEELLDPSAGKSIRWIEGQGWVVMLKSPGDPGKVRV